MRISNCSPRHLRRNRVTPISLKQPLAHPALVANLSTVLGGENTADIVDFVSRTAATAGSEASVTAIARLFDWNKSDYGSWTDAGISMQVVSLASPGVQVFDAEKGTMYARNANDQLAAAVSNHPTRLAGLAAIAPQAPEEAVKELDRALGDLGMKGVIVNSHTKGEYLDEEKFKPILEKIEALGVPLYIHPRTPSPQMIEPFTKYPGWPPQHLASVSKLVFMRCALSSAVCLMISKLNGRPRAYGRRPTILD